MNACCQRQTHKPIPNGSRDRDQSLGGFQLTPCHNGMTVFHIQSLQCRQLRKRNISCTPRTTLLAFKVEVEWKDFQNKAGHGRVVPFGSEDSGLFYFFDADNWEMLVKVLDGCGLNDHFWVFAAATTNVEYTLRVTDTQNGTVKEYLNPLGTSALALTDTGAFATCP